MIEWNGRSMRGKSFQDVEDIIAESRQEPQVELIVSRRIQPKYAPTLSKGDYYKEHLQGHITIILGFRLSYSLTLLCVFVENW